MEVSVGPNRPLYPLSAESQKRFRYTFAGPWPNFVEPEIEAPADAVEHPIGDHDLAGFAMELCAQTIGAFGLAIRLVTSSHHTPFDQEQCQYGNLDFTSLVPKCSGKWRTCFQRAVKLRSWVERCREIDDAGGIVDSVKLALAAKTRRFTSFDETFLTAHEAAWHYCEQIVGRTIDVDGYNSLDYIANWSMNLADVPTDMPWGIELEYEKNIVLSWLESGISPAVGADTENKSEPEKPDVRDLCIRLKTKWRKGQTDPSQMDIAREFVKGTRKDPALLLRQCRRFPYLWR